MPYEPQAIEPKWQKRWAAEKVAEVDVTRSDQKYYMLNMFPYPSGDLHVGHGRNYILGDALYRFLRMKGMAALNQPTTTLRQLGNNSLASSTSDTRRRVVCAMEVGDEEGRAEPHAGETGKARSPARVSKRNASHRSSFSPKYEAAGSALPRLRPHSTIS